MEIGAKTRARLVLLGAIPVVGCGVVGCADYGGRSAEVSSSSASSLSSVSSGGVSSDAPTLRPSLDAGGESGSSAGPGAGGGSGVQAGQNELGMYTVKCQVVKNESGNPIVGLVYGNHKKDPNKAEKDADLYTNKFGKNVHKRHCDTQSRYKNSGAFTVDGDPI